MNDKKRTAAIVAAILLSLMGLLWLGGLVGQLMTNYQRWMDSGGMTGKAQMAPIQWSPLFCVPQAFTRNGLKGVLCCSFMGAGIVAYVTLHDKFDSKTYDDRGFRMAKDGTYGTASWMTEQELHEVLEIKSPAEADGVILGARGGNVICMPKDTRLNRHIAIFGASGTRKSRGVIRPSIFSAIRRGESVVITDPKAELYNDCSELFRKNGYRVQVYNLVSPEHSDSWNCMGDLNGDSLLAQTLCSVIISNTSTGKGDAFWDNGELNLLKALVLYVDQDKTRDPNTKHLPAVYQMLTQYTEKQLTSIFEKLPVTHPAKAPYNLFAQSSDTVKSGIILGLGTRLQVLQTEAVQRITSQSDIDLTAPAREKTAIFVVLSDQDATMSFLSSLFFSFLFIRLVRYADTRPGGHCDIPVNLIFDEFNNVGKLGAAPDGSDFARSLSTIRSRDIRVMVVVQSLGQLQNRYGNNLWAEIIGNCDIQLMLGCTDDVTAEYISARSGEMSIEVNTTMTVRQTIAVAQVIPQYRQSEGQGKRRLLTPDEVLRLSNDELLIIIRGHNLLKAAKFDYTNHPMIKEMQPVSILDYNPVQTLYYSPVIPEPQTRPEPKKPSAPKKGGSKSLLNRTSDPPAGF